MIRLTLTALICLIAVPAMAQQITINAVCDQMEPASADGADYVPGVDVEGKPVVGADLNAPVKAIQYPIVVPIEIDVLKFLDLPVPADVAGSAEVPAQVAYVTLYEDGRVEYNGQDISEDVAYNCVKDLPETEMPPAAAPAQPAAATETKPAAAAVPQTPKAGGQPAPESVPSVQAPAAAEPKVAEPETVKPEIKSTPPNDKKQ